MTFHFGKSILIAEDDEDVRSAIALSLTREGWSVRGARDGVEALALFKDAAADIVITDLMMPRMDGIGLLAEVRAIDPSVPVIVLTGYATLQTCQEALKSGATDFVPKPFDQDYLMRILMRALNRRMANESLEDIRDVTKHAVTMIVPAELNRRAAISAHIAIVAEAAGFGRRKWAIQLAMDEAFSNAVLHGAKSSPESVIHVSATIDGIKAMISVRDPGSGFDATSLPEITFDEPSGRGIFLIRSFCDEARWTCGGNVCEMTFLRQKNH